MDFVSGSVLVLRMVTESDFGSGFEVELKDYHQKRALALVVWLYVGDMWS
jgi:hypothetical protein